MNVVLTVIILLCATGIFLDLVFMGLGSLAIVPVAALIFGVTSLVLLVPTYVRGG